MPNELASVCFQGQSDLQTTDLGFCLVQSRDSAESLDNDWSIPSDDIDISSIGMFWWDWLDRPKDCSSWWGEIEQSTDVNHWDNNDDRDRDGETLSPSESCDVLQRWVDQDRHRTPIYFAHTPWPSILISSVRTWNWIYWFEHCWHILSG